MVGRLKPGVTWQEARTDLESVAAALAAEYPEVNEGMGVTFDSRIPGGGVGVLLTYWAVGLLNGLVGSWVTCGSGGWSGIPPSRGGLRVPWQGDCKVLGA